MLPFPPIVRFSIGCFDGFQDWKQLKKAPRLDQKTLVFLADGIMQVLGKPFAHKWNLMLQRDLQSVAALFQDLADYLKQHTEVQSQ